MENKTFFQCGWVGAQPNFMTKSFSAFAMAAVVAFAAIPANAQNVPAGSSEPAGVLIELNGAAEVDGACRISLMATNNTAADIHDMTLETVLFRQSGEVDRLTLFNLETLPLGRPRVRQFDIAGLACSDLSQILINGVSTCEGDGMTPALCSDWLSLTSRIDLGLIG